MKELYLRQIAATVGAKVWQIENCADMFADGDTIPFISRYRKEKTSGMDDATVAEVKHWIDVYDEMEKRKGTILATIEQAGALTPELKARIEECVNSTELEDIYLPWRPKRRTKATAAKELGLEPLADIMWNLRTRDPHQSARAYVKGSPALGGKPGAETPEEALAGARDIIAERLSETALIRQNLRSLFRTRRLHSKATKAAKENPESGKYRSYFDFTMPLDRMPSHNLLAILRARKVRQQDLLRFLPGPGLPGRSTFGADKRGRSRRIQTPARAINKLRSHTRGQREGRYRIDTRVRREPPAAVAPGPCGRKAHFGRGPRFP